MIELLLTIIGILSAYNMNPTVGTIEIRKEWGQLPENTANYDVLIAVSDCSMIGNEATVSGQGNTYRAIVFDCLGGDAAFDWMTEWGVAAEVDYCFWIDNPHLIASEEFVIEIGKSWKESEAVLEEAALSWCRLNYDY